MNRISAQRILRWACLWSFFGILPARPSHAQVQTFDFEKADLKSIISQIHRAAAADATEIRTTAVTPSGASSRQAPGCASAQDFVFRVGDRVITQYGDAGTVRGIYPNGRLSLSLDGRFGYFDKDATTLARTAGCGYGYCVGERVITQYGDAGTVSGVYPNGKLSLTLDGRFGYFDKNAATLARTTGCGHGFCVGERVITKYGDAGTVRGIYPNGKLSLTLDGRFGYFDKDANTLARR